MYDVSIKLLRNTSGSLGEREMLWEHKHQMSVSTAFSSSRMFPQLFRVLVNFNECFSNSIKTRSTCFLFLLENTVTRKGKTTCSLWLSKCKFSLLAPSLRQKRTLVLCLHRVIQTRLWTNQRLCFPRNVF